MNDGNGAPRAGKRRAALISFALIPLLFAAAFLSAQSGNGEAGSETKPLWRQALGGRILGQPAIQGDTVTMVCDGGNLKSYTQDGRFLWDFFARGRLLPFVTRSAEGASYICRTNGIFIAVNQGGKEIWRRRLEEPLFAPAIAGPDGRIFLASATRIHCFTAAGYLLWTRELREGLAYPPVPDSAGGLLAILTNHELLEIDPYGRIRSRKPEIPPVLALPAEIPGEDPQSTQRGILVASGNGDVRVLPLASSEIAPSSAPPEKISLGGSPSRGVSRGGFAVIATAQGKVAFLSTIEGRILWTQDIPFPVGEGNANPELIFDQRGIYLLSPSGAAGFAEDGRPLWNLRLQGAAAVPALSLQGLLFSGGVDWILNAYRLEERIWEAGQQFADGMEGIPSEGDPRPSLLAGNYFHFDEQTLKNQLENINRLVFSGNIGDRERDSMAYLMEVAGSMGSNPAASNLNPPVQAAYRREATRLLGVIGNREIIPLLAAIFTRDPELVVKAAAAEAIGRIGSDPRGDALRAFASSAAIIRDDQMLIAIAAATGALCRFSGPPLSEQGIPILISLAGENRSRAVRERAHRELNSLR